jgi:hypothetical protein
VYVRLMVPETPRTEGLMEADMLYTQGIWARAASYSSSANAAGVFMGDCAGMRANAVRQPGWVEVVT